MIVDALDDQLPRLAQLKDIVRKCLSGGIRDQYLVVVSLPLDPGSDVHGVSDTAIFSALLRADIPGNHRAGIERDAVL